MVNYYKKYLKYKSKYLNFTKIKGGASCDNSINTIIKIESAGGNIFSINAAKTLNFLLNLNPIDRTLYYTAISNFLRDKLLPHVFEIVSTNHINNEAFVIFKETVEILLSNIEVEFLKLISQIANKISDLDTKIVLQHDNSVPITNHNIVAFGLTRIKFKEGELIDLSIPVKSTLLGSTVHSSLSKDIRLLKELEIIIFRQDSDLKTKKRIGRYIFQSIYNFVGFNDNLEHIPWYNINSRLAKNKAYDTLRAKAVDNRKANTWAANVLENDPDDPNETMETIEAVENNILTTLEYKLELPDDPITSVPLLCNKVALSQKIISLQEALNLLFSQRYKIYNKKDYKNLLDLGNKLGIFVQIYNPDKHDNKIRSKLSKEQAQHLINALNSKKTEIALKTELHACVLATINATEDLPYKTLEKNIETILADMNSILQDELTYLEETYDFDTIINFFSDVSNIHTLSAACATILEKLTYSELVTKWNIELFNMYSKYKFELDAEDILKNITRFVSIPKDAIKWDKDKLKKEWKKTKKNEWLYSHVFSSNNIYAENETPKLRILDEQKYNDFKIKLDLDYIRANFSTFEYYQKKYYFKIILAQSNLTVLSNFITTLDINIALQFYYEIKNDTDFTSDISGLDVFLNTYKQYLKEQTGSDPDISPQYVQQQQLIENIPTQPALNMFPVDVSTNFKPSTGLNMSSELPNLESPSNMYDMIDTFNMEDIDDYYSLDNCFQIIENPVFLLPNNIKLRQVDSRYIFEDVQGNTQYEVPFNVKLLVNENINEAQKKFDSKNFYLIRQMAINKMYKFRPSSTEPYFTTFYTGSGDRNDNSRTQSLPLDTILYV